MNPTNRNRTLWLLVGLVSVHALVTTAVFLGTGALPNGLLVFTLVVFGVCALAAIYFMANAPRRALRRVQPREERVVVETPEAPDVAVRLQVEDVDPVPSAPRGIAGETHAEPS